MKLVYVTEITEVVPIDLVKEAGESSVGAVIDKSIARTIKHQREMREEHPEMQHDRMKSITVEFEDTDTPYLNQVY
jgi:hypothetical protein